MALLLSVALAMLTISTSTVVTPRGVQCPTAKVQKVTEVRYVRNCCGKLVAQTIERAPKEGEAEFKQCRCAEKKESEKHDQAKAAESRPSMVIWVEANAAVLPFGTILWAPKLAIPWSIRNFHSVPNPPVSPPPRFI